MRVLPPMPRLDETVKQKLKGFDVNKHIKQKHFRDSECDVSFDRRREKVVVRSKLGRVLF